jgi:peptidoglycan/LPS O-acetylase OafA/YrhL
MRNIGLDIIRGVAVILVLTRHSDVENNIITQFGWLGVDLFFVLSGFLISNILFNEYKENNSINIKRFLIRRSFKIFPPFYFFVFLTLLFNLLIKGELDIKLHQIVSELFYLQSYFPRIWLHTWTLAVEEHFYLFFSATLFILIRNQHLENRRLVVSTLVILLIISFCLRLYISYPHRNDDFFSFVQTHLRSDGILIGVLLSYLLNFTKITYLLKQNKLTVFCLSILMVAPGFYFKGGSYFMNTIGLTTVNIGFSLILLLSLDFNKYYESNLFPSIKAVIRIFSFIGVNSYSIYLWHLEVKEISYSIFHFGSNINALIYILISIIIGIIMSYLIEKPFLRIRDYLSNKIPLYNNRYSSFYGQ